MPRKIEEGDTLVLHVTVESVWEDGRVTFRPTDYPVTIPGDSSLIVEVIKAPKRKTVFDKPD
jgi:hypothetical protein